MNASSITRKQLVAVSGLGLAVFVLMHMSGNLLVFFGDRAYNEYSHALISNPLIYLAEIGLVALFLGHVFYTIFLSLRNRAARPIGYAMRPSGPKRTSWIQRSLIVQGVILLVFIILHLLTFKYGPHYTVNYGKGEIRDLFKLMTEVFQDPGYVTWYVIAVLLLGMHLSHGVSSTIQSLGLHHPRYQGGIKWAGRVYAVVVTAGFISQPVYMFLVYKG